jgi:glycerol kinase
MLLDTEGQVRGYSYQAVDRLYSHPGWVEQSPQAIAESVRAAVAAALAQAGVLGLPAIRVQNAETTVRAAALLAGLGAGAWPNGSALPRLPGTETVFEPRRDEAARAAGLAAWARAI